MTDENPQLKLRKVRISFPRLFEKNPEINGNVAKPGAAFMLHPQENKVDIEACQKAIDSILAKKFKGKKLSPEKYFFRDGDLSSHAEYEGFWIASASTRTSNTLPRVMDRRKQIVTSESDLLDFYPGIYCNALLAVWWQDNQQGGKRVNAELLAVQVLGGGEQIAGGGVSEAVATAAFDDEGEMEGDDSEW